MKKNLPPSTRPEDDPPPTTPIKIFSIEVHISPRKDDQPGSLKVALTHSRTDSPPIAASFEEQITDLAKQLPMDVILLLQYGNNKPLQLMLEPDVARRLGQELIKCANVARRTRDNGPEDLQMA